jgi:uncharacterized protein (DUF1786 family)
MSRFLIIDIGAGTMDVLWYDFETSLSYKAVAASPTLSLAHEVKSLEKDVLITGCEMGGGPISEALIQRATNSRVVMGASAAATIHHDLHRVGSFGIQVVDDEEAEALRGDAGFSHLTIGDLDIDRLRHLLQGLGVPFSFEVAGICAQDHGIPPKGISHLDYRHTIFKARMDDNPHAHALVYRNDEVPPTFSRLTAIGESAKSLPADEIYLMDSGMAAILGATLDPQAARKERILTLDVATSHTVGGALEQGEICGFFEYHTRDITMERLETLMPQLAAGDLDHTKILSEGGHGAYTRTAFGFEAAEIILVTGPKRWMLKNTRLPIVFGAPLGDNMMTGTAGGLEAIRRRKGLGPLLEA